MNAYQNAVTMGWIRPEVGTLSDTLKPVTQKLAAYFLPTMTTNLELPIVPDGTVQGARYFPPNTQTVVMTPPAALSISLQRLAIGAAVTGAVVGGLIVAIVKRRK